MNEQQWNDLATDENRWAWILANTQSVFLFLDNDATYVQVAGESFRLKESVGNSEGVFALLNVLGIQADPM